MELTKNEKLLIEAVREMDHPPYNILLWFTAGLEEAQRVAKACEDEYRVKQDQRLLDIAHAYMKQM